MDAAAHSDEEYEDDLELLQKELDALKDVLGRGYQQIEVPVYDEEAPEEGLTYEQSREPADDEVETDYAEGEASFALAEAVSAPQQQQQQQQHQLSEAQVAAAGPSSGSAEVQALRAALEANRALQARLQRLLRSINRASDRNANLVMRVKTLDTKKETAAAGLPGARAQAAAAASAAGIPLPSTTSMFWQVDGLPPPPHPEWAGLAPLAAHLPHTFRRQPWTEEDRAKLKEGVLQMVQEERLNAALAELQARVEAGGGVTLQDYDDVSRAVGALTLEAPEVQATADQLSLPQWGVVLQRLQLGVQRSPLEAQLQWRNALRPALARGGGFSGEEDAKLWAAVERLGDRAWPAVARELGGSRTPLVCLARFRALQAQRAAEEREGRGERLGELSAEELARLGELVKQHNGQWKVIGPAFGGGWSGEQLYHMWRRHQQRGGLGTLQEHRKGRWTKEEDEQLLKAMAVHHRKWFKVAAMVPGRSDVQCRERFMNVLNPEVRQHEAWTPVEDERLRELVPQFTKEATGRVKWSAVAAQLEGRTDKQCAIRYKAIKSGSLGGLRSKKTPSGKSRSRSRSKAGASDGSEPSQPRQPRSRAGAGSKGRRQRHTGKKGGQGGEEGEGEGEGELMPGSSESEGSGEEGAAQRPQRARRRSVRVTWDLPSSSSGSGSGGEGEAEAEAGEGAAEQEQQQQQQEEGKGVGPAGGRGGSKGGGVKCARSASVSLSRQGESASAGAGSSGRVASQPTGLEVQHKVGKRPAEGETGQDRTDAGEAEEQQEAVGAAAAAACQPQEQAQRQPKRQKRRAKQQQEQQQQVKRAKPSTRMAAAPPAPTATVMPCTRTAAVGREVWVWWIVEENTRRGRLYPGTIDSYDHTTGMHTVEYGEERPEQHALAEENVAWDTGEVTGPGAVWPEDGSAQQPVLAPDLQPGCLEEQQEQQQQPQEQQQEQHGGSATQTADLQLLSSGQLLPQPQAADCQLGSQGQQQQQEQQTQHCQPQQ